MQPSTISNHTIIIGNMCVLKPTFGQSSSGLPVKPSEVITYKIGANIRQSPLSSPLFAILLPKELTYVGNESISFSDYFKVSPTPMLPPVILMEHFNENGDTLVKFEFKGDYDFHFNQKAKFTINFDAMVATGAKGLFSCAVLLNTLNSIGIIPSSGNVYHDSNNIANDPFISKNYAMSKVIENQILFFISVTSNKKVKGLLNLEFHEEPTIGHTLECGTVDYKIP